MSEKMLSYKPFTVGKFTTDGTIIYNGQFSTVCLGFNTETQEKVVIKIAKKSFEEKSTKFKLQINREIELLKSMSHPNIVKLYDVFRV
jgi:serine/threonine protein kinase